jgi:hypothetical protein
MWTLRCWFTLLALKSRLSTTVRNRRCRWSIYCSWLWCAQNRSKCHLPFPLLLPRPAVHRFSLAIWRPISVDWSADYGIGGLPSTSQRAVLCCLLRRRDTSKNPEQCSFSESQYSGSKQHGILGRLLILSLPGRRTSARWERRQLKDWACLAPSLTGEAACPSETVCCSTSSSSVLWWITHVWSGGSLPAATSGICKCYNPSVFALRLTHLGTLVTGKFTRIWGFHSSPTTSEHWLRVSNQS